MSSTPSSLAIKRPTFWLLSPILLLALAAMALFIAQPGLSSAQVTSAGVNSPELTPTASATPGCPPNWNIVSSPNPLTNNYLKGVAVASPNDVWAVGYYYDANNGSLGGTLFEHWNGSSWTQVPGAGGTVDHQGRLNAVAAVSTNDVWAVGMYYPGTAGQNLIEHWNGTQWSIVPNPNRPGYNELLGVAAIAADDVWAVGDTPGNHGTLTEHWNGSYWAIVPSPPESFGNNFILTSVSAVSTNDVWAVGYQDRGSGTSSTLTEHWNGTQWSIVTSPNPGSYYASLYGVTAIASNDVWAVGAYSNDGGSTYPTLMLHWNGVLWTAVPGNSTNSFNSLRSVAAVSPNDIWAVGLTTNCALCLTFDTLIEHWNGTQWSVVPSPNGNNEFNRLFGVASASTSDVWTVGYSDQYNYPYLSDTLIEHHTCATPSTATGTPPTSTATSTSIPTSTPTACNAANTNYTITASTGATVVPATTDIGLHCDECSQTIALPFSFALYGQSFNSVIAGSNGTLGFVSNSNTWRVACMPSQEFNYAILPYWQELHLSNQGGGCPGCGVFTSIEGTAPNRTFNIEWRARDYFYTAPVNVEVRLYEGNSTFEVIYGSVPSGSNQQVTVGVQQDLGTRYTQYVCYNTFGTIANGTKLTFSQPACGSVTATPPATGTAISTSTSTAIPASPTGTRVPTGTATATTTRTVTSAPTQTTGTAQATQTAPASTRTAVSTATTGATGTSVSATNTPASTSTPPAATTTPTACTITFSDVQPDNTFYAYVRCLSCQGILGGYDDGTFRPNNLITRGQIAKIVSNSAGLNDDPGAQLFEDVPSTNAFYLWVNRLSARGYMSGYPCGGDGEPCGVDNKPYFRPFANATRGQIAKIVSNAAGYSDTPTGQMFEDVPASNPFYLWVQRLASRGYMGGYPCGGEGEPCGADNKPYFRWGNNATRGQTAKIVSNTFFPNCVSSR